MCISYLIIRPNFDEVYVGVQVNIQMKCENGDCKNEANEKVTITIGGAKFFDVWLCDECKNRLCKVFKV